MYYLNSKKATSDFSEQKFDRESLSSYIIAFFILLAILGLLNSIINVSSLYLTSENKTLEDVIGSFTIKFVCSICILIFGIKYTVTSSEGIDSQYTDKLFVFGWIALIKVALISIPVQIVIFILNATDVDLLPGVLELALEAYFFFLIGRMMTKSKITQNKI